MCVGRNFSVGERVRTVYRRDMDLNGTGFARQGLRLDLGMDEWGAAGPDASQAKSMTSPDRGLEDDGRRVTGLGWRSGLTNPELSVGGSRHM